MKNFELGYDTKSLTAVGVVVGSLMLVGCGGGKSTESQVAPKKGGASSEACHFDKKNHVQPFPYEKSTSNDFCIEDVYPMGVSEVIDLGDSGEMGLIGMKIRVGGREYNCVVPTTQPGNGGDSPQVRGEAFSLKESCVEIPFSG